MNRVAILYSFEEFQFVVMLMYLNTHDLADVNFKRKRLIDRGQPDAKSTFYLFRKQLALETTEWTIYNHYIVIQNLVSLYEMESIDL